MTRSQENDSVNGKEIEIHKFPSREAFVAWCEESVNVGDWQESLRRWRDYRAAYPDDVWGFVKEGIALANTGATAEAISLIHSIPDHLAGRPELDLALAEIAMSVCNYDQAGAHWQRLRDQHPKLPWGYIGQARLMLEAGKPHQAEELLFAAVTHFPEESSAFVAYARCAQERGDAAEALSRWQAVMSAHPDIVWGYVGAADALTAMGRTEEAQSAIDTIGRLFPMVAASHTDRLSARLAQPHRTAGSGRSSGAPLVESDSDLVARRADFITSSDPAVISRARDQIQYTPEHSPETLRARDAAPSTVAVANGTVFPSPATVLGEDGRDLMIGATTSVEELSALAHEAMESGDFGRAFDAYAACAKSRPDWAWPQYRMGECLFSLNRVEESIPYLQRAILLQQDFQWGHYYLALALSALGNYLDAKTPIRLALRLASEEDLKIYIAALRLLPVSEDAKDIETCFRRVFKVEHLSEDDYFQIIQAWLRYCDGITGIQSDFKENLCELMRAMEIAGAALKWWPLRLYASFPLAECDCPFALSILEKLYDEILESEYGRFAGQIYQNGLRSGITRILECCLTGTSTLRTGAGPRFLASLTEMVFTIFGDHGLAERLFELVDTIDSDTTTRTGLYLEILASRSAHYEIATILGSRTEICATNMRMFMIYANSIQALTQQYPLVLCAATQRLIEIAKVLIQHNELALSEVLNILNRVIDTAFDSTIQQTMRVAVSGDTLGALRTREAALNLIADLLVQLEAITHKDKVTGAELLRARSPQKVVYLGTLDLPQCYEYRVAQKAATLQLSGVDAVEVVCDQSNLAAIHEVLSTASVAVFARLPATPFVLRLMLYCRRLGIKVYYDVDDLVFNEEHFPPPFETYGGSIDQRTHVHLLLDNPFFRVAMKQADSIIVSTKPLKRIATQVVGANKPIFVHRNMVGARLANAAASAQAALISIKAQRETDQPVRIFFGSGTKAHKGIFQDLVAPVLRRLLNEFPRLVITLAGHFEIDTAWSRFRPRIELIPMLGYDDYLRQLAIADINIAVTENSVAADCKSELKWIEAGIFGIPTVTNPTANYRDVAREGKDVLYADNALQWYEALRRLVQSPELRAEIGHAVRMAVRSRYMWETGAGDLLRLMGLSRNQQMNRVAVRRRVLFINTFFWPQSIGGATRIAEGLVESLARQYGDELELFVLCANLDNDAEKPYLVEQYWFGPSLVTRINAPARAWADYEDEIIERFVRGLIREYNIDLVHIHSTQLLTAAVLDAAKEVVPTIVTLHDGWWLSEHQFLTTPAGQVFQPMPTYSEFFEPEIAGGACKDLRRRITLQKKLLSATRILSVSESFARIYETAGISNITINENGVFRPDGEGELHEYRAEALRVGFVGGISRHKGFHLFRAAFLNNAFDRLVAVVIDHEKEFGYVRNTQWGSSKVQILGKFPQSQVRQLYSHMDVLAAPSIWPESFGLVARESLMCGVPVIASDRGDIGRQVRHGHDGWVIDVSDEHALADILQQLNDDPTVLPRGFETPAYRTIDEQADELVGIYRDIFNDRRVPKAISATQRDHRGTTNNTRSKASRRSRTSPVGTARYER
jgi:glycosyltransferase involved in cell wall biosynthesis/tetratricopeptide (TPR) repeat protein